MAEMLRFFGRRKGKPIRSGRAELMEKWLPKLSVKVPTKGKIKLEKQFGINPESLELEIGFGGGEHLAEVAKRQPKTGFLGAEPFQNGVASLLAHLNGSHTTGNGKLVLEEGRVDNVRIWPGDIRELFEKFPDGAFKHIYLLYPDPWPKKRHAERRFINTYNIPHLYRLLTDEGELMLATDVAPYVEWALEKMAESDLFIQTRKNIHTAPKGWISTRYEKKGIAAGRTPSYLIFKKKQKKVKKCLTETKKYAMIELSKQKETK